MSDPIGDMLTRIRNGYLAVLQEVSLPHSQMKENVGQILLENGYLKKIVVDGNKPKQMVLTLKYKNKQPAVTEIERVSRPGRRIYVSAGRIQSVLSGLGINIISTSSGLMTGKEARRRHFGGELICRLW